MGLFSRDEGTDFYSNKEARAQIELKEKQKNSIADRVKSYLEHSEKIKAKGIARISQRAVVVNDNYGETDVYFDAKSYRTIHQVIFGDSLFPPSLRGTCLGLLPGKSSVPEIRGYADALRFARRELEPIVKEAQYLKRPVRVK
jgi:hypothetical protein